MCLRFLHSSIRLVADTGRCGVMTATERSCRPHSHRVTQWRSSDRPVIGRGPLPKTCELTNRQFFWDKWRQSFPLATFKSCTQFLAICSNFSTWDENKDSQWDFFCDKPGLPQVCLLSGDQHRGTWSLLATYGCLSPEAQGDDWRPTTLKSVYLFNQCVWKWQHFGPRSGCFPLL